MINDSFYSFGNLRELEIRELHIEKLLELLTPELDIFSAVIMARRDLDNLELESAVRRLRVDADKLRPFSQELYDFVNKLGEQLDSQ